MTATFTRGSPRTPAFQAIGTPTLFMFHCAQKNLASPGLQSPVGGLVHGLLFRASRAPPSHVAFSVSRLSTTVESPWSGSPSATGRSCATPCRPGRVETASKKFGSVDSTMATPISSSCSTSRPPTEATNAPMLAGRLSPFPTRTYWVGTAWARSEEHTSELQSQSNLVCRLLLEKKKNLQDTQSYPGSLV